MAKKKLAVIIFGISIILFLMSLYLNSIIILERNDIPARLTVDELASFDINKSALTFGKIIPGSSSQKEIIIQNTYDFPIKIEIESEGNITKFLNFEKTINLEIGEEEYVKIDAIIPVDEEYGEYSGVITITTKRDIL